MLTLYNIIFFFKSKSTHNSPHKLYRMIRYGDDIILVTGSVLKRDFKWTGAD
jgi:hypothetical protein